MVEQGFIQYIATGLAALTPPVVAPGFETMLKKDFISPLNPKAFVIKTVGLDPDYNLTGQTGWTEWKVQLDAHGQTAKDRTDLARALETVLRGAFRGNFADPDNTYVFGIFRLPGAVDGYSDINRTFVRSLEYSVVYQQT